jgi:alpha-1,6-mannosyltransferase
MLNRRTPPTRVPWLPAAAAALALEAAFAALAWFGNLESRVIETIAIGLVAGIVYLVALYALERGPDTRRVFWLVLLSAIAFRLTLAPLKPTLSDDIYRYRFDGRAQLAGLNPYLVEPDDPRLASLGDPSIRAVPGYNIRSVYPPFSELVYAATARLAPSPAAFKTPFLLADLLVLAMLAWQTRRGRMRTFQLAIYGWNPLVVVEFAASGHNDALALAATVGATLLIIGPRKVLSMCMLALGMLAKAFPVVLVPLWLVRLGWPRRGWAAVAAASGVGVLCAWPYRSAMRAVLATFQQYQRSFQDNNASAFAVIEHLTHSWELSIGLGAGLVAGLAIWAAARRLAPERAAFLLFGAALLAAPNGYPWYFTWVVPFLALAGTSRYLVPWLMLTILQFLSYQVLIGYQAFGTWQFAPLFLWLTYGPFYAWLLWNAFTAPIAAAPSLTPDP